MDTEGDYEEHGEYRDGFTDALVWVLANCALEPKDEDRLNEVLDG